MPTRNRLLSGSDLHSDDPDFWQIRDIYGVTGLELFTRMCEWAGENGHTLWWLGDFIDWMDRYPEAMSLTQPALDELVLDGWLEIWAGNHDRRGEGVCEYYREGRVVLEPSFMLAGMHGDLADPFWTPEGKDNRRKRLRIWAGEKILKGGRRLESRIPWADNAIMGGLGWMKDWALPRGHRLGREGFQQWCLRWCEQNGVNGLVSGHLHEAYVYHGATPSGRPCSLWNTCAWVPVHHRDPEGLYVKGEIWAGLFDWRERQLYRWTLRGLEKPVRREGTGAWVFQLIEPWDPDGRGRALHSHSPDRFLIPS